MTSRVLRGGLAAAAAPQRLALAGRRRAADRLRGFSRLGGARTFIVTERAVKEHMVNRLTNGILEADDAYYRDGVPPSAFSLPEEVRLDDVLNEHSHVDPFQLVQRDIDVVSNNINKDIGTDHPILKSIASHFFETSGKQFRPVILCLLSRALSQSSGHEGITQRQVGLSEITELIHTASLLHDDVIDEGLTRRGVASVHSVYGNKLAILGGDFLLARASVRLARLRHADVTEIMATVIEHLVKGEIMQLKPSPDQEQAVQLRNYITKTYYKTASLISNSCKSVALLGDVTREEVTIATEYGKNLGIAFQLIDDILDFEGKASLMGKPTLNDMRQGMATLPVLLAAGEYPVEINALIGRKFKQDGDVEEAMGYVIRTDSIAKARVLAHEFGASAVASALQLPDSPFRSGLISIVEKTLRRNK